MWPFSAALLTLSVWYFSSKPFRPSFSISNSWTRPVSRELSARIVLSSLCFWRSDSFWAFSTSFNCSTKETWFILVSWQNHTAFDCKHTSLKRPCIQGKMWLPHRIYLLKSKRKPYRFLWNVARISKQPFSYSIFEAQLAKHVVQLHQSPAEDASSTSAFVANFCKILKKLSKKFIKNCYYF